MENLVAALFLVLITIIVGLIVLIWYVEFIHELMSEAESLLQYFIKLVNKTLDQIRGNCFINFKSGFFLKEISFNTKSCKA